MLHYLVEKQNPFKCFKAWERNMSISFECTPCMLVMCQMLGSTEQLLSLTDKHAHREGGKWVCATSIPDTCEYYEYKVDLCSWNWKSFISSHAEIMFFCFCLQCFGTCFSPLRQTTITVPHVYAFCLNDQSLWPHAVSSYLLSSYSNFEGYST